MQTLKGQKASQTGEWGPQPVENDLLEVLISYFNRYDVWSVLMTLMTREKSPS